MINNTNKFIFIHIPRTGGTSIEVPFFKKASAGGMGMQTKHSNMWMWKEKMKDDWDMYYKFTFIRNPWDVVISKYLCGWYNSDLGGNIGHTSGKSLEYFLDNYTTPDHEHGDTFLEYFDPDEMDYIGRYETRAEDMEEISEQIGCKLDSSVRSKATGKKKHYTEYYDSTTREMVADKYAGDIEMFKYTFEK